jgi:hypothetical protein
MMNDQTTLADAVARAFREHGITAALTALIGGTMALIAAITRKAFTNEALLDRLDRELIWTARICVQRQRSPGCSTPQGLTAPDPSSATATVVVALLWPPSLQCSQGGTMFTSTT